LFLFYDVDGDSHFPRLFAGIDIALVLAVLNVLFFIYLYGAVLSAFATADGAFAALKTATAQSKNTP
jgi:hypothetical protein